MSAIEITPPFPVYFDETGEALESGYIYVGTANLEPIANPIAVYWDVALAVTASQPIRTINGYPSRAGSPASIYADSDYSITVKDKHGRLIYTSPTNTDPSDTLRGDLANSSDVGLGDALVAVKQPYGASSVARTVHAKLQEFVNVRDFGAVGDGSTDDSTAVQSAITYCLANNRDLKVDGICKLASPVNIDQPRDNAAYDNFFTIFSDTGGGFKVSTAINMFSSSLDYVADGANWICPCALVRWKDVTFESTDSALGAYVLAPYFMRTAFVGCSFSKIKCMAIVKATKQIIAQSIYLIGCNARRYTGTFFSSDNINFDVRFDNCLIESGGDGIYLAYPVGGGITNSTIEGQDYFAVKYTGPRAFAIQDCYFEANGLTHASGCSIDGSLATGADGGESMNIIGCYFSGDSVTPSKPQIKWGDNTVGLSLGNMCTTTMHGLTATSRINSIGDYAETALSNYCSALSATLLRDKVGIGNVTNPLEDVHVHAASNTRMYMSDDVLGTTYGGFIVGYGVAGKGGRVGLGNVQNGVFSEFLTVDELGATQVMLTGVAPTVLNNSQMTFQLVDDTHLKILVKGGDGVTRSNTLVLA